MKIGLAQINCQVGDVVANSNKIKDFILQAKQLNCQLVIFPEMSDLGYDTKVIKNIASTISNQVYSTISKTAKECSMAVVCGMSESVGQTIYNSLVYFDNTGEVKECYRKMHLFTPSPVSEDLCFTAGEAVKTFELGGVKFGLTICYDLRFPELYRKLMFSGAKVLINSSAWPAKRAQHWDVLTKARAIENQAFFVGVGRVGEDAGIVMNGNSRVILPNGEIQISLDSTEESIAVAELDLNLVDEFRNLIPACRSLHDSLK